MADGGFVDPGGVESGGWRKETQRRLQVGRRGYRRNHWRKVGFQVFHTWKRRDGPSRGDYDEKCGCNESNREYNLRGQEVNKGILIELKLHSLKNHRESKFQSSKEMV